MPFLIHSRTPLYGKFHTKCELRLLFCNKFIYNLPFLRVVHTISCRTLLKYMHAGNLIFLTSMTHIFFCVTFHKLLLLKKIN